MKAKAFQDREAGLRRFTDEVNPQKSASVADEFGEFLRGDILADWLSWKVVEGTDHGYSRLWDI